MIEGTLLAGRYEVGKKVGAGGMSDVYKAKDLLLSRNVAIKVLKQEFSEDRNFVSKFRTEAQSAAGLEHPNIVNIYDVGIEEGMYYIVMEYVDGITLKTYIEKKGQLNFKESVSIAIQVSRGIEAAHNKDIIHRDIKPQNIIISSEGKVKVTDFGIAKAASANTISSDVMGSVHYSSPEQARNGFVDERSDIYSLGIVMYEMITGRVPFDGETTVAVAIQHLQDEMVPPSKYAPNIPSSFEKIIQKCTQKSQERRYQSISEVMADLRHSLMDPEGDFVVIPPIDNGVTKVISREEVKEIRAREAAIKANKLARLEAIRQEEKKEEAPEHRKSSTSRKIALDDNLEYNYDYADPEDEKNYEDAAAYDDPDYDDPDYDDPDYDDSDYDDPDYDDPDYDDSDYDGEKEGYRKEHVKETGNTSESSYEDDEDDDPERDSSDYDDSEEEEEDYDNPDDYDDPDDDEDITIVEPRKKYRYDHKRPQPKKRNALYDDEDDEEEGALINPLLQKSFTIMGLICVIGLVLLILYLLGSVFGLFRFSNSASSNVSATESQNVSSVEMISVLGMDSDAAQKSLARLGLSMEVSSVQESDRDEGTVIEQSVAEGEEVQKGSTIEVVVAGVNPVEVPMVVGYNETNASQTLSSYQLTAQKTFEYNDTIPSGTVISQSPEAGEVVAQGTVVKLVISQGGESTAVPNVKGTSEEYAKQTLEDAGFLINVKSEYSNTVSEGFVIRQTPESGKQIEAGKTVTITVSLGKKGASSDNSESETTETETETSSSEQ